MEFQSRKSEQVNGMCVQWLVWEDVNSWSGGDGDWIVKSYSTEWQDIWTTLRIHHKTQELILIFLSVEETCSSYKQRAKQKRRKKEKKKKNELDWGEKLFSFPAQLNLNLATCLASVHCFSSEAEVQVILPSPLKHPKEINCLSIVIVGGSPFLHFHIDLSFSSVSILFQMRFCSKSPEWRDSIIWRWTRDVIGDCLWITNLQWEWLSRGIPLTTIGLPGQRNRRWTDIMKHLMASVCLSVLVLTLVFWRELCPGAWGSWLINYFRSLRNVHSMGHCTLCDWLMPI